MFTASAKGPDEISDSEKVERRAASSASVYYESEQKGLDATSTDSFTASCRAGGGL